jgi:hypothetical protein
VQVRVGSEAEVEAEIWALSLGSGLEGCTNGDDQRRTAVVWGQSGCLLVTHRLVGSAVRAAVLQVQVPRWSSVPDSTLRLLCTTQRTVAAPRVSAQPDHVSCTSYGIVHT